jgi:hypothetical protein
VLSLYRGMGKCASFWTGIQHMRAPDVFRYTRGTISSAIPARDAGRRLLRLHFPNSSAEGHPLYARAVVGWKRMPCVVLNRFVVLLEVGADNCSSYLTVAFLTRSENRNRFLITAHAANRCDNAARR